MRDRHVAHRPLLRTRMRSTHRDRQRANAAAAHAAAAIAMIFGAVALMAHDHLFLPALAQALGGLAFALSALANIRR